jgi:hypothetical protein
MGIIPILGGICLQCKLAFLLSNQPILWPLWLGMFDSPSISTPTFKVEGVNQMISTM